MSGPPPPPPPDDLSAPFHWDSPATQAILHAPTDVHTLSLPAAAVPHHSPPPSASTSAPASASASASAPVHPAQHITQHQAQHQVQLQPPLAAPHPSTTPSIAPPPPLPQALSPALGTLRDRSLSLEERVRSMGFLTSGGYGLETAESLPPVPSLPATLTGYSTGPFHLSQPISLPPSLSPAPAPVAAAPAPAPAPAPPPAPAPAPASSIPTFEYGLPNTASDPVLSATGSVSTVDDPCPAFSAVLDPVMDDILDETNPMFTSLFSSLADAAGTSTPLVGAPTLTVTHPSAHAAPAPVPVSAPATNPTATHYYPTPAGYSVPPMVAGLSNLSLATADLYSIPSGAVGVSKTDIKLGALSETPSPISAPPQHQQQHHQQHHVRFADTGVGWGPRVGVGGGCGSGGGSGSGAGRGSGSGSGSGGRVGAGGGRASPPTRASKPRAGGARKRTTGDSAAPSRRAGSAIPPVNDDGTPALCVRCGQEQRRPTNSLRKVTFQLSERVQNNLSLLESIDSSAALRARLLEAGHTEEAVTKWLKAIHQKPGKYVPRLKHIKTGQWLHKKCQDCISVLLRSVKETADTKVTKRRRSTYHTTASVEGTTFENRYSDPITTHLV